MEIEERLRMSGVTRPLIAGRGATWRPRRLGRVTVSSCESRHCSSAAAAADNDDSRSTSTAGNLNITVIATCLVDRRRIRSVYDAADSIRTTVDRLVETDAAYG